MGITEIVPTTFALVMLAGAVHEAIFPLPLATRPMAVLELVHAKVAPVGELTKFPIFIVLPGQSEMFVI